MIIIIKNLASFWNQVKNKRSGRDNQGLIFRSKGWVRSSSTKCLMKQDQSDLLRWFSSLVEVHSDRVTEVTFRRSRSDLSPSWDYFCRLWWGRSGTSDPIWCATKTSGSWRVAILEKGLEQGFGLNAFLADVYHHQEILKAGKIPKQLILHNPAYTPKMGQVSIPNQVYTHVAGIDMIRVGLMNFMF